MAFSGAPGGLGSLAASRASAGCYAGPVAPAWRVLWLRRNHANRTLECYNSAGQLGQRLLELVQPNEHAQQPASQRVYGFPAIRWQLLDRAGGTGEIG
jgi:hypothetical protein